MARRVHFTVEKLSEPGRAVVHRGLREKWIYPKIIAELKQGAGETVSQSALARYAARWSVELRSLQECQEQGTAIVDAIRSGDLSAGQLASALLAQALAETREALKKADPVAISYAQTARERLDLKREEIELRKQELAFNERKFEAMEKKLEHGKQRALEIVNQSRDSNGAVVLTAEQVQGIKEMYDLK
jgi:F0F1-type ATP synthase membrane subunit b/b'